MKIIYSVLLFLMAARSLAQSEPSVINGKITADVSELNGIYIFNSRSNFSATSEKGGYFSIPAKIGDTLMFSAVQFKGRTMVVSPENMKSEILFVRLESMVHMLDEVTIIKNKNIDARTLGIIPKGQKSYTPAERHLQIAGDFKPIHILGLLGGSMQVDPLINAMTGRTTILKRELAAEKKEVLISNISNSYEEKLFVETLKIPELYVRGFLYYLIEDEKFVALFKSKNKAMTLYYMGELALKYNELISGE